MTVVLRAEAVKKFAPLQTSVPTENFQHVQTIVNSYENSHDKLIHINPHSKSIVHTSLFDKSCKWFFNGASCSKLLSKLMTPSTFAHQNIIQLMATSMMMSCYTKNSH